MASSWESLTSSVATPTSVPFLWRRIICGSIAERKGEAYESRMLDMDTYSMITFKSDWEGIRDVRVLTPKNTR